MNKCCIIDIRGDVHPAQLSGPMMKFLDWLIQLTRRGDMERPELLSTCRTHERQKYLQSLWDQGMREGLAVRPVDGSKHLPDPFGFCHAFDLANDTRWLQIVGPVVVAKWTVVEWGGTYLPPDPRHFEER